MGFKVLGNKYKGIFPPQRRALQKGSAVSGLGERRHSHTLPQPAVEETARE